MKKCTRCGEIKPLSEFNTRKNKSGRVPFPECKVCGNARNKANYEKNREAVIARTKEYNRIHRDEVNARARSKSSTSREEIALGKKTCKKCGCEKTISVDGGKYFRCKPCDDAQSKQYTQINLTRLRPKRNAKVALRRARKLQATPAWSNKDAIKAVFAEAAATTRITGVSHVVDHIVPLKSEFVCGLHVPANMNVITWSANREKSNLHWPDMWEPWVEKEEPDWKNEWVGMPEFVQPDKSAKFSVTVHFESKDDLNKFSDIVGRHVSKDTKGFFFPVKKYEKKVFVDES